MTVASGLYLLTREKEHIDTLGQSWEAEDNYVGLVTDTHTPDFDLDDFVADIDNEITGGNYARENLTTTEYTISGGVGTFDADDTVYDNGGSDDVTIADAIGAFHGFNVGTDGTDPLGFMSLFSAATSCTNSTLTVAWSGSGIWTEDLVP